MHRYFIEVAYNGAAYSGFQVQQNANSVQAEVERALDTFYRLNVRLRQFAAASGAAENVFALTGSSRTDAGVHALQNYFHFDVPFELSSNPGKDLYHLNAILPGDIVVKNIIPMPPGAHCRFDALSREYHYHIYAQKNPFLAGRAYYYPYRLDQQRLQEAAAELLRHSDFTSFSKRNSQVHTFICQLYESRWVQEEDRLVYKVRANRFLRGMVRGLTGTMLLAGRNKISTEQFRQVIERRDCTGADFSVPGHGLYLVKVEYPQSFPLSQQ